MATLAFCPLFRWSACDRHHCLRDEPAALASPCARPSQVSTLSAPRPFWPSSIFSFRTAAARLHPQSSSGVLALSLNSEAYIAEIIRAGILSIPRGQVEAGVASGADLCSSACVLSSCRRPSA